MKAPKNIVRQVLFFGPLLVVIFFLLWWLGGVSGPLHYRREQLSPEEKISQNIEGLVKRNLTSKKQLREFRLSLLPKPLTQLPNPQTDSSAENLLSYARNLSLVLRPLASERPSELGTVAEILEAGGQGWEKTLTFKEFYHGLLIELQKVPVPKDFSQVHLRLINKVSQLASLSELMSQINEEPLLATGASQKFGQELPYFYLIVREINGLLQVKKVYLSPEEQIKIYVSI